MDQAGLHAYSQVSLVSAETLLGGMINISSVSDDDNYVRASDETIPFMQAPPDKAVAPEAPPALPLDRISVPAVTISRKVDEYGRSDTPKPACKLK